MPARETGKQRAIRIPLDYYRHPDRLERWKLRLGILALAAAVAWPVLSLLPVGGVERSYSRGPVAAVHTTWKAECTACHTPFAPIRGDGWATGLGASNAGSEKCTTCHAGPPHHATQKPGDLACATCHHDHRGRDASLVRVADGDCTSCHAALPDHFSGDKLRLHSQEDVAKAVTHFAAGAHPDFKSGERHDHLRFNHKLHLTAGMKLASDSKGPFTFGDIADPAARRRYWQQQFGPADQPPLPGKEVQLTCASCHVTDAADAGVGRDHLPAIPAAAVLSGRRAGAYMLPITYEVHCQACHPLTFGPTDKKSPSGSFTLPHRLQPDEVRAYLEARWTARALADEAKAFEKRVPVRPQPLPGKLLDPEEKARIGDLIRKRVVSAALEVFSAKGCLECHLTEPGADPGIPKRIVPTQVPDVWFTHAVFDHSAHRALKCAGCHAKAEVSGDTTKMEGKEPLLPGMDTCLRCHAPRAGSGETARGGARFDCALCHRYHNGDVHDVWNSPLPGPGSRTRGVPEGHRLSVERFLSGSRPGRQD
jgi:hypothetical protein